MRPKERYVEWRQVRSGQPRYGIERSHPNAYGLIFAAGEVPTAGKHGREEALALLRTAAEVEHALLVTYLYAAYSVDDVPTRLKIARIARQEMGHLITVQNLMLAIGGHPYFDRQDQSPQPADDPIPFLLEPFSKTALAKFIEAEMPDPATLDASEKQKVLQIALEAKRSALVPLHRVGALYAAILLLFQGSSAGEVPPDMAGFRFAEPVCDEDFGVLPEYEQATSGEWEATPDIFVDTIANRQEAIAAIQRIAVQGEGTMGAPAAEQSHFQLFLALYDAFDEIPPALPVPTHPNTASGPQPDPQVEAGRIKSSATLLVARLANLRYEILLTLLSGALNKSDHRSTIVAWALEEMRFSLATLAKEILPSLDRNSPPDGAMAACPFELSGEPFPTPGGFWKRLDVLIGASATLLQQIAAEKSLPESVRGQIDITIPGLDSVRRQYIQDNHLA